MTPVVGGDDEHDRWSVTFARARGMETERAWAGCVEKGDLRPFVFFWRSGAARNRVTPDVLRDAAGLSPGSDV